MQTSEYRYELRQGENIVATRHFTREQPPEVGDRILIASTAGIVRSVEPMLGERELRLVVEIRRDASTWRRPRISSQSRHSARTVRTKRSA